MVMLAVHSLRALRMISLMANADVFFVLVNDVFFFSRVHASLHPALSVRPFFVSRHLIFTVCFTDIILLQWLNRGG